MYKATKRTRAYNSFVREAITSPRDLYAQYGMRVNPKSVHSTDAETIGIVVPESSAVISQMIAGQQALQSGMKKEKDSEAVP